RRNPQAFILVDCCQCFDAKWDGESLAAQGDAAVLAFGIGKPMTTLYGGAVLTDRDDVAAAVRGYRAAHFRQRPRTASLGRTGYLVASWLALTSAAAGITHFLESADTPLRRYLDGLRAREGIRLPADGDVLMTATEASVGRKQLERAAAF